VASPAVLSYDVSIVNSPLANPMGDFGEKFRTAREAKDLSLDDVSNVTKISSRMLQAIEQEHFDVLPGGVFNKGFIRAYAKHLGLNPEEAVSDYLSCLRQAQVDAHEVWEPAPIAPARPAVPAKPAASSNKATAKNLPAAKPSTPVQVEELPELHLPRAEDIRPPRKNFRESLGGGIPWGLVAVSALVIVLAVFLWTRHSRSAHTSTAMASTKTSAPQPAPATVSPAVPASASQPSAAPPPTPAASPAHVTKDSTSQAPQTQAAATTHPAATSPTAASDTEDRGDVTIRNFGKSSTKPADKTSGSLNLVIRATENSWISVIADGQFIRQETLIAPANTSVRASQEITVRVGNAAGVNFLFNNQELAAQGAEAEVKTFVFDSSGMRVLPTPPPPAQNN
jgi:cytoskeleton protein RodZ